MLKVLARTLLLGALLLAPSVLYATPAIAQFDQLNKACEKVGDNTSGDDPESTVCAEKDDTTSPITGSGGALTIATNLLSIAAGVIAVIIIVVAGIGMILSGGDSNKVNSSRNTIIYAAVGIVVIVLARTLVIFIINQVG